MTGEIKDFLIVKELRGEKFAVAKAPVATQTTISDPTGGATTDAEARAAINDIIDVLQAFGLIA